MLDKRWPFFLNELHKSDKYKDLTLVCQGQKIKVNSAIAGIQSPVIDRALSLENGYLVGVLDNTDVKLLVYLIIC